MKRFTNSVVKSALVSVVVAAGLTTGAAGTANAATDYFGSIAISVKTGNIGWAYDTATRADAEATAVQKCNAADCESVVWFQNGCGAVAQADNLAWGWGYGASRADAEAQALSHTNGPNAKILRWVCTTNHL